jgi:peptidoglycan/LPS O-acetylase OafA/YrhL
MRSFAEFSGSRNNNFTLLRFVAALLVIISHSVALSEGRSVLEPMESLLGVSLGSLGVLIFFVLSGYLIAMSYSARHDLKAFVIARGLRIFPALFVCTLISAFVWGPLMTSYGATEYFKDSSVYRYVLDNTVFLLRRGTGGALPGVFTSNPIPEVFNGSLWTLPLELRMYVMVAVIGVFGLFRRRRLVSFILLLALLVMIIAMQEKALRGLLWRPPAFFLAGVLFYANRDFIPVNGLVGLALGLAAALAYKSVMFPILAGAFLVYAAFFLAYVPGGWIRKFGNLGDYSYGLYIYAFPVQQTLAVIHPGIKPLSMFLAAFPLTLGLAVLSWHLVEKPALALKEQMGAMTWFKLRRGMVAHVSSEEGIAGKCANTRLADNPAKVPELPPS